MVREAPEYAKKALREVPPGKGKQGRSDYPRNVAFEACKHDTNEVLTRFQDLYGLDDLDMLNLLRTVLMERMQPFLELGAAQVMAGLAAIDKAEGKGESAGGKEVKKVAE